MARDLLITGAALFVDGGVSREADSIAIEGGRIRAIGSREDASRATAADAEVIDAHGGLVTPGFLDCHAHPVQAGLERLSCDLTDSTSAEEAVAMVRDYAAAHPDLDWIVGGGWHMDDYPGGTPSSALLDDAVPGRKIYLVNADHHGAWVSSAGIRAAGITPETGDPADGKIDRTESGELVGTFQEGAMEMFQPVLPLPDLDSRVAAIVEAQTYYHSLGVTGWHDAIVGEYAGTGDATEAYLEAVSRGVLHHIVTAALWLRRDITLDTVDEAVADYIARRERFGDHSGESPRFRLRATAIKIMMDGVPESRTASMKAPYLDACGHPTGGTGTSHFSKEVLLAILPKLACAGFQLHFHAIGDQAVLDAVEVLEAVRAAGADPDLAHHIAHLQSVDIADVPRFVSSGAIANMQALWAANSRQMLELNRPLFGDERYRIQYPFASLALAGAPLAMGSDWPVSTPDPWQAIHVAVTRREPGSADQDPLAPGEALDLASCITAYTRGSSRVFLDQSLGRIEVGAPADLAIADRNPFAGAPEDIWTTTNATTVLGGEVVYRR